MSTVAEIEAAIRKLPARKAWEVVTRVQGYLNQQRNGASQATPTRRSATKETSLGRLARVAAQFPADLPVDASAQHDHYLYGLPKRP